jgi:diguanylate cyclase (GGDEF)-like protein
MRSLADYESLTDTQKAEIQKLVMKTLREKDYSPENYREIIRQQEAVINAPCNQKLQAALVETTEMIKDFNDLLLKRKGDVETLGNETVEAVEQGRDPQDLIENLRSSFKRVVTVMEQDAKSLTELSMTDSLTRLNNRRAFDESLALAIEEWLEFEMSLSLLMIDIDHFKRFNDDYGHRIGDQALATVAKIIKEYGAKKSEEGVHFIPARYGGEEFAVILSGVGMELAARLGESLRRRIENYNFIIRDTNGEVLKRGIRITVSVGVSEMTDKWKGAYAENIVEAADKALYAAKQEGRNLVFTYDPETGEKSAYPEEKDRDSER